MQLRSGMLTPDLEKRLVASFLLHGSARIHAQATGTEIIPPVTASPLDKIFYDEAKMQHNGRAIAFQLSAHRDAVVAERAKAEIDAFATAKEIATKAGLEGCSAVGVHSEKFEELHSEIEARIQVDDFVNSIAPSGFKELLRHSAKELRGALLRQEHDYCQFDLEFLTKEVKKRVGIKLTPSETKVLALKLMDAQIQLYEAEAATLEGNWSHNSTLQQNAENSLKAPYVPFTEAIEKYQDYYRASKPNIKPGTVADMVVECRVLLEIVGNISIEAFNTMETVTKVKTVLRKYPLNRQQRYRTKPLNAIMKTGGYDVIEPKTANEYIKRARAIVEFALKSKMLLNYSVWVNELFPTVVAAEDQRSAYGTDDVSRLIDAICSQPLWSYDPPKPERFWLILIALFHGLRLSNIVALTKGDVCKTDAGMWIFKLRSGKSKNTVRDVAISDCLLLLGFQEWVEGLQRHQLFQDTSDSFSKFYNRDETRKGGYIVKGFESKFVTTDQKKCLYSLRHTFAGEVYGVSSDFKITSDMMGHSSGGNVTSRYMKGVKTEKLKEVTDKLAFHGIDLNKLELRAIELFAGSI